MRRCRVLVLVCAALTVFGGDRGSARTQPPAAVLTDVVGRVQVQHGGTLAAVTTACPLALGECVITGPGSSARILFPDRPPVVLGADARHVVSVAPAARVDVARAGALQRVWEAIVGRLRSCFVGECSARPGAARGGNDPAIPHPVHPRNTAVLGPHLELRWTPVEGVDSYRCTISFYDTQRRVRRIDAPGTTVGYPQDATALEPGRRYCWCVEEAVAHAGRSEVVWFALLDAQDRAEYVQARAGLVEIYEPGTPAWHEAAAHLAADYALYADAIEHLEEAIGLGGDSPALRRALSGLYETIDLPTRAAEIAAGLPELSPEEGDRWQQLQGEGASGVR